MTLTFGKAELLILWFLLVIVAQDDVKNRVEPLDTKPVKDEPDRHSTHSHLEERWQRILLQIIGPFFIAGLGMVGAGVILNIVQVSGCPIGLIY